METTTHTNGARDLQERLQDPETRASLNHLLDRLDAIERAVDTVERLERQLPPAFLVAADAFDDAATAAADRGVVLDERAGEALRLAERLTEPRTVDVLMRLIDRLDRLEELADLADRAPEALAMAVDVIDAEMDRLIERGRDPEQVLRAVGSLGSALAETQDEAERGATPRRGLFGLFGALRDPDVQRTIGFLTGFARRFGRGLDR